MKRLALALLACLWATAALCQANGSNTWTTPGNQTVGGLVQMCPNASGIAAPCNTGIPPGTPVAVTATGTTAAVVATLPGVAAKTTFICGFNVTGTDATTASTVSPTVGPLVGPTTFTYTQGRSITAPTTTSITYNPCIPASGVNTAIAVTSPADANATSVIVNAWGFQF